MAETQTEYVELNGVKVPKPEPVTVHFYIQTDRPSEAKPLPEGVEIVPFTVKTDKGSVGKLADPSAPSMELNADQFKSLFRAVAAQSGWVPPECLGDEFLADFDKRNMHVLMKGGKPIGFSSIESDYKGNHTPAGLNYIGVIPSEQGTGNGSAFFDQMIQKAWSFPGTEAVQLDTVPAHDKARNGAIGANEMYEKKGFRLDGSRTADRTGMELKTATGNPDDLAELNFPEAYKEKTEKAIGIKNARPQDVGQYFETELSKTGIDKAYRDMIAKSLASGMRPDPAAMSGGHIQSMGGDTPSPVIDTLKQIVKSQDEKQELAATGKSLGRN